MFGVRMAMVIGVPSSYANLRLRAVRLAAFGVSGHLPRGIGTTYFGR